MRDITLPTSIVYSIDKLQEAIELSKRTNLPISDNDNNLTCYFVINNNGLFIKVNSLKKPQQADFYQFKRDPKQETLRSCLGKTIPSNTWFVDTTAGWGVDGILVSKLGYKTTLIEQSKTIYLLLQDAYKRYNCPQNLSILHANSIEFIKYNRPDIIYLDPMYPNKKGSLSRGRLQVLQSIVGEDYNIEELFTLCIKRAKQRVIVKRPINAIPIKNIHPTYTKTTKMVRFDIYITKD